MLNKFAIAATIVASLIGAAHAQQTTTGAATPIQGQVLNTIPADSTTVTNYYKQNVYDPSDAKIGEITDVLVGKDGKIEAFMVSVGGFLGVGEKDVAVPFSAVHGTEKNGTWLQVPPGQGDLGAGISHSRLSASQSWAICPCRPRGRGFSGGSVSRNSTQSSGVFRSGGTTQDNRSKTKRTVGGV